MISISVKDLSKQVHVEGASDAGDNLLSILEEVSLEVDAETSAAIQGVSGSGKSTLLSLMAGLDLPTHGEVWLNGQCLNQLSEPERTAFRAQYIGFVFQQFYLIPQLSVLDNVLFPLQMLRSGKQQDSLEQAKKALGEVGMLHRLAHRPAQLSGGEQQRVAIARAFVLKPQLLFADEPTANLDVKTAHTIIDLLFSLQNQYRSTLVFVTHDPKLSQLCQKQWRLEAGRIACVE